MSFEKGTRITAFVQFVSRIRAIGSTNVFSSFIKRFFTVEKNEDKKLLRQLIYDTDPAFIRWALNAILHWDCKDFNGHYIHIHGSTDMILPIRFAKPTHVIAKAGHMMVLTKAGEINGILQETLSGIKK